MLKTLAISALARAPWITIATEQVVLRGFRLRDSGWQPATATGGRVAVHEGLALASVSGSPAEVGAAEGELFAERLRPLLGLMKVQPLLVLARLTRRFRTSVAAIDGATCTRLEAVAVASGVKPKLLIEANALVDAQCSAVVALGTAAGPGRAGRPLRVARNMDFFPAAILGPGSVVEVVRLDGKRPYAAIGWPGSAAVISGMNDAGLVCCVLINQEGPKLDGGEPVCLRLARILQEDATVEQAVARFADGPVGSCHYVLIADATTAAVVWHERDGMHRDDPRDGWLTASNGPRAEALPQDERGRCLRACVAGASVPDAAWMRQVLSASYMRGINAQAMVFEPATLTLELALGTGRDPAATGDWLRIPLAGVLAGDAPDDLAVERLRAEQPLRHYTARKAG